MAARRAVSRGLWSGVLLSLVLILASVVNVQAQGGGSNDGRINQTPWVNGFGAVAVYCLDENGHPGGSFSGGGIQVLNTTGQRVLFASDVQITQAQRWLNNFSNIPAANLASGAVPNFGTCVNTSYTAQAENAIIAVVTVQKQVDAVVAKYHLSQNARLITPDLSALFYSLDRLDHLLEAITDQETALLGQMAALRAANAQANAQTAAVLNSQLGAYMSTLDAALSRLGLINGELGPTQKALQTTISQFEFANVGSSAQQGASTSDFASTLNTMQALVSRVGNSWSVMSTLFFRIQNARALTNTLRTQLGQMSSTPNNGLSAETQIQQAEAIVHTLDPVLTQACTAPVGAPGTALLAQQGVYSLFALPGNRFQLSTVPDSSGRSALGTWQNCGGGL